MAILSRLAAQGSGDVHGVSPTGTRFIAAGHKARSGTPGRATRETLVVMPSHSGVFDQQAARRPGTG
jgi:hypothetical protein